MRRSGTVWVRGLRQRNPEFGPGIDERVAWAREVTPAQVAAAKTVRKLAIERLQHLVQPGDILCLPTSPRVAPLRDTATSTIEVTYRYQAICLLSIAGLGGLPEISLPLASVDNLPLGLSLIGPVGADRQLLRLARDLLS